jgi:hypothetical protein
MSYLENSIVFMLFLPAQTSFQIFMSVFLFPVMVLWTGHT